MLDEICPVQFIEGINESERVDTEKFFQIQGYPSVAIMFTPSLTFCLCGIEICLVWSNFNVAEEYDVQLLSDSKDNPSDIVLREGKLTFDVTRSGYGWRNIALNPPIVVVSNKNYWLGLDSRDALFALMRTKEGIGVPIRAKVNDVWSAGGDNQERFMLKFHGRILPIAR